MSKRPMDRHHIISRRLCRDLGINPNFPGNVRKVKTSKHRAFHTLFGSMSPQEAIEIIKREWSLDEQGQIEFERLLSQRITCFRCNGWIHPGYEVYFQKKIFHSTCAADQAKVIRRKKRSRFRVIIGGQR